MLLPVHVCKYRPNGGDPNKYHHLWKTRKFRLDFLVKKELEDLKKRSVRQYTQVEQHKTCKLESRSFQS